MRQGGLTHHDSSTKMVALLEAGSRGASRDDWLKMRWRSDQRIYCRALAAKPFAGAPKTRWQQVDEARAQKCRLAQRFWAARAGVALGCPALNSVGSSVA